MARTDLRKSNTKLAAKEPALKPRVLNVPGFTGTLPYKQGQFTEEEGDVPAVLREEEAALLAEQDDEAEKIRQAAGELPEPVDFDDLTEEHQEDILEAIKQAGQTPRSELARKPVEFKPRHPSIAKAKALADKIASRSRSADLKPPKPAPPSPAKPTVVEEEDDTPVVEDKPAKAPAEAELPLCLHCHWPVGKTCRTDPTTFDKQAFVAAIKGQQRFYKAYDLFNGQIQMTFRGLTIKELDMVVKQLMEDWNSGKIASAAQSVAEAHNYQLALALHSFTTPTGVSQLPYSDEYDCDPPTGKGTILPQIVEHVFDTAFSCEAVRKIASKSYGHFLDTCAKLEVMAEEPSFWPAIEGSR